MIIQVNNNFNSEKYKDKKFIPEKGADQKQLPYQNKDVEQEVTTDTKTFANELEETKEEVKQAESNWSNLATTDSLASRKRMAIKVTTNFNHDRYQDKSFIPEQNSHQKEIPYKQKHIQITVEPQDEPYQTLEFAQTKSIVATPTP